MPIRAFLLPDRQQLTGYEVSFRLLCRALRSVGMNVHVDDYALARKNPNFPISISGSANILKDWRLPNPALLGPGLYEHPKRLPRLMEDERFRGYLVKGEWMKRMFGPYYGEDVVKTFFSGIDLTEWKDERETPKKFDFLVYDKIRWNRDRYVPELLDPILRELESRGLTYSVLSYGNYRHAQYASALAQSRSMIFLCEHETQGMAWQEALAANVPILAWDQGFWLDPNRTLWEDAPVSATSVPGFSDQCGERFSSIEHFHETLNRFLLKWSGYSPREWVRTELSFARSAAVFLEAYRSVASVT